MANLTRRRCAHRIAYCNFRRIHKALRVTLAMESGTTDHVSHKSGQSGPIFLALADCPQAAGDRQYDPSQPRMQSASWPGTKKESVFL
jgi:hypothetical protein